MGRFDQAARYAAKLKPLSFQTWLLPALKSSLRFRGWLDARTLPFPGEADRTCDTVAEWEDLEQPDSHWALVLEFQAEPDPNMLDRLLEYLARARAEFRYGPARRGKYFVGAVLVNLTGPAQPHELQMFFPCGAQVGLHLQVFVKTLSEEDAHATLQRMDRDEIDRCILPWIPLMHGGGEAAIMEEWKRLAGTEPNSRWRSDYAALALVFSELSGYWPEWQKALEGWNMRESQQVLEWQAQARAEGMREGMLKSKRADLLRILQLRLKLSGTDDLKAAVEALTDYDELSRWLDEAVAVNSLDEFRQRIRG